MAWVEQTGKHSWRVRYTRPTDGHGSVSGFTGRKAAEDYAGVWSRIGGVAGE